MNTLSIVDHVFVFLICGVVLQAVFRGQPKIAGAQMTSRDRIATYWGNSAFLYAMALVALLVWWFQGRAWSAIGFAWPQPATIAVVAGLTIVFLVWYATDWIWQLMPREKLKETSRRWRHLTPFMPTNQTEVWHGMHMSVCAGVTEEIVFRGFLINYFATLFAGQNLFEISHPLSSWAVWLAIMLPGLLFGMAHLYSGWSGVIRIVWLAALFGAIYVVSRSLLVVVILHIFIDVVACWLSPWIMRQTPGSVAS